MNFESIWRLGCSLWGGIYLMVSGGEEEGLLLDTVERLDTRDWSTQIWLFCVHFTWFLFSVFSYIKGTVS